MGTLDILHCLDSWNIGGIQELVLRLHQNSSHQHDTWGYAGTMTPYMQQAGMVNWAGGPPAEVGYDVVVGHGVGGWSYNDTFKWAKARGCHTVEVMHSNARSQTDPALVDAFVSLNHIADKLNLHMPNRQVIYVIVPTDEFLIARYTQYIGRLSRLAAEKRPGDFVELARKFPGEKFVIAGDGAERERIEPGAPSNVRFVGMVRDFPAFYGQLKLFVFPTQDECCSASVAMAQAAGVSCIVQDIPSLRETTGGYAVFCKDLNTFEGAIRAYMDRPDDYREMALAGWEWAREQFTPKKTAGAWDAFLEGL